MGRLTRDPDVRYSQGEQSTAYARYTVAVDRRFRRDGDGQTADFISCVAFGRQAEFAEKYLRKGIKIALTGRIQTGSYTNRDGQKVYTTDVVVEEQEFAESKAASGQNAGNYNGAGGYNNNNYNSGNNGNYSNNNNNSNNNNDSNSAGSSNNSGYNNNAGSAGGAPEGRPDPENAAGDGFMNIPDGIDEELPFA